MARGLLASYFLPWGHWAYPGRSTPPQSLLTALGEFSYLAKHPHMGAALLARRRDTWAAGLSVLRDVLSVVVSFCSISMSGIPDSTDRVTDGGAVLSVASGMVIVLASVVLLNVHDVRS
jgi:hypothetical protein